MFMRKCAYLIIPLVLLLGYVEWHLSRIPTRYSRKKELLSQQAASLEVLVLGSSHALHGFDPAFFSRPGFNLAGVSQSLYYDYQLLVRFIDQLPRLKLVIVPVSYFILEYNLSKGIEYPLTFFYERVYGIPLESNLHNSDFARFSLLTLYGGEKVLGYARRGFKVDLSQGMTTTGFFKAEYDLAIARSKLNDAEAKARVALHHSQMAPATIPANLRVLTTMVELLQGRGVSVVFVTLPVIASYAAHLDAGALRRMQEAVAGLCASHGIAYVDYTKDPRFFGDDFMDVDHLSPAGAEKFSRIINQEIIVPLLRRRNSTDG